MKRNVCTRAQFRDAQRNGPVVSRQRDAQPVNAFTRTDLVVVLAVLALLAGLVWPALANTRPRSDRIICLNNLRQIGLGMRIFASNHGDKMPWILPEAEGGLYGKTVGLPVITQNAYADFYLASNELVTPKILNCPADIKRTMPRDWPQFGTPPFRNNSLSYFVGLHGDEGFPTSLLAGDRNIGGANYVNCGRVGITAQALDSRNAGLQWTNSVHPYQGNLLFGDGRVRSVTSAGLLQAAREGEGNSDSPYINHVIIP